MKLLGRPLGSFARDFLTLVSGTALGQLIPILLTPVLARIYSPEDIGLLALFLSVINLFGPVSNGKYELAIVLPKEKKQSYSLAKLGILLAVSAATLIGATFIFGQQALLGAVINPSLEGWLLLTPLGIAMVGSFNVLNYVATHEKKLKILARAQVIRAVIIGAGNVTLGLLGLSLGGLVASYLVGNLFINILLIYLLGGKSIFASTVQEMKVMAKEYWRFPAYSIPSVLANTGTWELTNVFIDRLFSAATLGFYSMGSRILLLPSFFIGNVIRQLLMKDFSDLAQVDQKKIESRFIYFFKRLFAGGLLIFIPAYFLSEWVFPLVLGAEWAESGVYAKILIPMVFARFVVAPLSMILNVLEKQKFTLFFQLGLVSFVGGLFYYQTETNQSIETFLTYYSWGVFVVYLLYFFLIWQVIKRSQKS